MMNSMDGLPYASDDASVTAPSGPVSDAGGPVAAASPSSPVSVAPGKEYEPGYAPVQEKSGVLTEVGKEPELPKEVLSAGVRPQPTAIPVPQPAQAMGVKPAGQNVPMSTGKTIALPLTDVQIAQGLRVGITSSWRWMAEWCSRKLKQMHMSLRAVGGSVIRVKQ